MEEYNLLTSSRYTYTHNNYIKEDCTQLAEISVPAYCEICAATIEGLTEN